MSVCPSLVILSDHPLVFSTVEQFHGEILSKIMQFCSSSNIPLDFVSIYEIPDPVSNWML